ncbi:MAG: hypothetical protein USCAAHI_00871 [Beijerinckiaceae bacterium]|jgi:hypothetical protein|nr:MAG: hypothetical protein USCAAHI_00871 [Beijerinckiaceae bacterium]
MPVKLKDADKTNAPPIETDGVIFQGLVKLYQGPAGRFRYTKKMVFLSRMRAKYYPEIMPVGKLIAFKPARGGVRLRAAPVDHATIVVFTGVWQERPADQECQTKRVRRASGKRSKKSNDKTGGPHE